MGHSKPSLDKVNWNALTTDSTAMSVKGSISIVFLLFTLTINQRCTLIDVDIDVILVLDFLTSNNCSLDLPNSCILTGSKQVKMSFEGKIGCCGVTLTANITIPPCCEIIIMYDIVTNVYDKVPDLSVIEASNRFIESDWGLVAKTLIRGSKVTPVRLVNLSTETKHLYKGTYVAVDKVYGKSNHIKKIEELSTYLQDLHQRLVKKTTTEDAKAVRSFLIRCSHLFASTDADLQQTKITEHTTTAIKQHPRRIPVHMQEEADRHGDGMLERGLIEECTSPWSSPIMLVKKTEGIRFCIDYRKLNYRTVKDAYPPPRIDASLGQFSGAKYYSTLNLNPGYWQVKVAEKDRPKTTFPTRKRLYYRFKVMPFGSSMLKRHLRVS